MIDPYEVKRSVLKMKPGDFPAEIDRVWPECVSLKIVYPNGQELFFPPADDENKPCSYCGSRCSVDSRGNCRSCGAPK